MNSRDNRYKVLPAFHHWVSILQGRQRRPLSFAISKDSRRLDRLGPSYSLHYWDLSVSVVEEVIQWDLDINGLFSCKIWQGILRAFNNTNAYLLEVAFR